jgi:NADP-dependent 3-hydroxy acid dehydrogenase YdfG
MDLEKTKMVYMMQAIKNQVILVSGATDGLGKRVAHYLAEREATVLLHGRSREKGVFNRVTISACRFSAAV